MLESTPRRLKVIVPREDSAVRISPNENEQLHVTLAFCVAADGGHTQPSIVLSLKESPLSLEPFADNFFWSGQSTGWMTAKIFTDWVGKVFIPHVNGRRTELDCRNERALLFIR